VVLRNAYVKKSFSQNKSHVIKLERLSITDSTDNFDELCQVLQQMVSLKYLKIFHNSRSRQIFDADKWKQSIETSLPYLQTFKFYFQFVTTEDEIQQILKNFQSDFWQKQHHWYTEYSIHSAKIGSIYTLSNAFKQSHSEYIFNGYLSKQINTSKFSYGGKRRDTFTYLRVPDDTSTANLNILSTKFPNVIELKIDDFSSSDNDVRYLVKLFPKLLRVDISSDRSSMIREWVHLEEEIKIIQEASDTWDKLATTLWIIRKTDELSYKH
jgi:hypothetical protein